MKFLICLGIIAAAYIVFVLAPAIVSYKSVFCRRKATPLEEKPISKTHFAPFEKQVSEDISFMRGFKSSKVTIEAFDGEKLVGNYYSAGKEKLAVCFHGYNSTPLNNFASTARFLIENGYDVLLISQRGHGESGGKCSTLGILEQKDVIFWSRWACEKSEIKQVFLIGVSMGCASVAYASDEITDEKVKGLILDCGFASPYSQIKNDCRKRYVPYWAMLPLIVKFAKRQFGIDIKETVSLSLQKTRIPCLFVHGNMDETVSLDVTKQNFECCAAPKELFIAENGYHATAFVSGGEKSKKVLMAFLNKYSKER